MARDALGHYDLVAERIAPLSRSTNALYAVRADGARYVLRLARPGWRALGDLQLEALWLDALARDTDIPAPRVIRARDGASVVTARAPQSGEVRHATLMTWLPGILLGRRLSEHNLEKMGALFAQLHTHGAAWRPAGEMEPRRFLSLLGRGEPDVLFDVARGIGCLPGELAVMRAVRERVDRAYAGLDPADLRVIHCDLWHDNIKLYRGRLCPFDFEDTVVGFRLHDIAMAMLDLAEEVGLARYEALLPRFRSGYERHLAWPAGDLAALQVGRMLWRMNYVAAFERGHFATGVAAYVAAFERFLDNGELSLPRRPRSA